MSTKKEKCIEDPRFRCGNSEHKKPCKEETFCQYCHKSSCQPNFAYHVCINRENKVAPHSQSESIEWEKDNWCVSIVAEAMTFARTEPISKDASHITRRLREKVSQAITTAVAKEKKSETLAFERGAVYGAMRVKKELAEEVEKMGEVGHEPTNDSVENARREKWNLIITGKNIVVEKVLQIIKH